MGGSFGRLMSSCCRTLRTMDRETKAKMLVRMKMMTDLFSSQEAIGPVRSAIKPMVKKAAKYIRAQYCSRGRDER